MLLLDRLGLRATVGKLVVEVHAQLYPYMEAMSIIGHLVCLERLGHITIEREEDYKTRWQLRVTVKGWAHHVARGYLDEWPQGK